MKNHISNTQNKNDINIIELKKLIGEDKLKLLLNYLKEQRTLFIASKVK